MSEVNLVGSKMS